MPRSCTECGHTVSGQARFCERCGAALPSTAEARPPTPDALARKILTTREAIEGERKQVTVMFVDIVRSMELGSSVDPERWGELLDRFLAIIGRAVHSVEGTLHQFTGDGVMALFGAPLAHEDHAQRACLAALQLHRDLAPFAEKLAGEDDIEFQIRCGLNSGEVIIGSIGDDLEMDYASIGNTNGLAKRMEALAHPGSTALSRSTAALVKGEFELRELGRYEVKGVTEPQPVFELLGRGPARSRLEAAETRGLSAFIGRDSEVASLDAALESALAGEGRVVAVVGEPGVGKSRLCQEFVRGCRKRDLTVDKGSAVAHGRSTPLLPVLAMFRDFFGIGEGDQPEQARDRIQTGLLELDRGFAADLPLIFDFLGVPDPERPLERIDPEARQRRLLAFVRNLVEARSRREPAVIVLEDLHWVDEASAAFLEELARAARSTRTLLVATFRPEYGADWLQGTDYERVELAPLDEGSAGELLRELLGDDPSLDGLGELIGDRTAGNPFFIEEVVQTLAESGHLAGERGAYRLVGTVDALVLPPTVQAVLAARIDRLPAQEKALLQRMSVIGREASELVLREASGLDERELSDALAGLAAAQFLTERGGDGHAEIEFRHPLTQEVAYGSQLSGQRARAHGAVADAIERLHPDGLEERAALLAHHRESAGEMLEAARWHSRAAVWVSASSPRDGMRHWRRVREIAEGLDDSNEVASLGTASRLGILSLAWRLGMSHEEAAALHAESLGRISDERSVERVLFDMAYAATLVLGRRERQGTDLLRASTRLALELGEPGLAVTVGWGAGFGLWVLGPVAEGLELVDSALGLAGADVTAGSGLVLACPYAACLWTRGLCAAYLGNLDQGWKDYERAIELAREHGDLETESYAFATRAVLRAELFVELEPALLDGETSVEVAERSGSVDGLVSAYLSLAYARAHARDYRGADKAVTRALEMANERQVALENEPVMLSTLARAKLGLGDPDRARAAAERAVAITEARSLNRLGLYAYITWARVLMATEGVNADEAVERALGRAFGLARRTGALLQEPHIRLELAHLARVRGDDETAQCEETEARRILAQCGAPSGAFEALTEEQRALSATLRVAGRSG